MTACLWSSNTSLPVQGPVLVWTGEDFMLGFQISGTWFETATGQRIQPTHWTVLPEPPKEARATIEAGP